MGGRRTATLLRVVLLVAVGGFAGATMRYGVALAVPGLAGTLVANAVGSLALGALVAEARYAGWLAEPTHLVAGTGFLSSFTTYSTFVVQSAGAPPVLLVGNVVATYALGFTGALLGGAVVERYTSATSIASGGDD